MGVGAGVAGTLGKSGNDKEEKALVHTISSEIANTANVGTTTSHTTTCTPEPGQKNAGLW